DLRAVAAVDLDGVGAVAALVEVGVIAGVPDQAVVAGPAEDLVITVAAGEDVVTVAAGADVVAALAQDGVVAGTAVELVVAGATGDGVVTVTAEDLRPGQGAAGLVERDLVVTRKTEDLDKGGVGDGRRVALNRHRAAIDEDFAGGVAADGDGVVPG